MDIIFLEITVLIILIVAIVYHVPRFKSWYADRQVRDAQSYLWDSKDYYLMKDLVLLTFDGLQKFDYLIISRFGIFVVMVQNYSGIISGSETAPVWHQMVSNKNALSFSNPSQVINERNNLICGLLNLDKTKVFPMVLFTGITGFRTKMGNRITYGDNYLRYIRSKTKVLFSANEIEKFIRIIEAKRKRQGLVNQSGLQEKKQQSILSRKQDSVCPHCGSELELRGDEVGSNLSEQVLYCHLYPTCRYKRPL